MGAWLIWCLGQAGEHLTFWAAAATAWARVPLAEIWPPATFVAPLRHALLLGAAAVLACGLLNGGGLVQRLFPLPTASPGERRAIQVLLGFAMLGIWNFGLALAGLFTPLVLWASFALLLVLPGSYGWLREFKGWRPVWPGGWTGWILLGCAPVVPYALGMLVPDAQEDTYIYHLANPEQFLRLHRFIAEGPALVHHGSPLTAEFVYALAVALKLDALPHLMQVIPFVAAMGLLVGWCVRLGGPAAGWMTAGAVATFGLVGAQMVIAKNDLAAAAYPLAGAVLMVRGLFGGSSRWLIVSAVLFGCGAAVKLNGQALLGLAWAGLVLARALRGSGGWRFTLVWMGMAALPLLPWLLKSWACCGDPVWPFLSACLPQALWDRESVQALEIMRRGGEDVSAWLKVGPEFVNALLVYQPALAWVLPLCLLGGGWFMPEVLWLAAYAAAGFIVLYVLVPPEGVRLALPMLALWAGVSSLAICRTALHWPTWARRLALGAGVVACWLPLGTFLSRVDPGSQLGYLSGRLTQEQYLARRLTTLWEMGAVLRRLPEVRRVVMVGEVRGYRLPVRYFPERCNGRNWAWVLSRECATPEAIRVRLRQMNCRHVVYNFIMDGFPHAYAVPFEWDDRQLRLWLEFVGRHLEVAVPPRQVDHVNGGFCVYRLRETPLPCPPDALPYLPAQVTGNGPPSVQLPCAPDSLPYLPGVESLYYEVTQHGLTGNVQAYFRAARKLYMRFPIVDYIRDMVARGYLMQEQWGLAYEFYLPGVQHGTIGDGNYWNIGVSAANLDQLDEAIRLMTQAAEIYPYKRADAGTMLAELTLVATTTSRRVTPGVPSMLWIGKLPPELKGRSLTWLNSRPLTLKELKGKVVLLDIWDYTCVHCLRALPYIKAWHRRYEKQGLVVIGIHCPKSESGKDPKLVAAAAKDLGLEYPIVLDSESEIWRSFHNAYWPRKWLVDHEGVIRYDHVGEGAYDEIEQEIQELLAALNPGR